MQAIGFQEAVEKVRATDARFEAEAYAFLRDALDAAIKRRKKARKDVGGHVNAGELLEGFRLHALQEFGPMARTVFNYWGVRSCEDIGSMVFNLVQAGVFGKTEEDSLDSFREGYDFADAFEKPFQPERKNLSGTASDIVGRKI